MIVVSKSPRTGGYQWIKEGSRPMVRDAGCSAQDAACTALLEAVRHKCKIMAPPEVAAHIPKEYLR